MGYKKKGRDSKKSRCQRRPCYYDAQNLYHGQSSFQKRVNRNQYPLEIRVNENENYEHNHNNCENNDRGELNTAPRDTAHQQNTLSDISELGNRQGGSGKCSSASHEFPNSKIQALRQQQNRNSGLKNAIGAHGSSQAGPSSYQVREDIYDFSDSNSYYFLSGGDGTITTPGLVNNSEMEVDKEVLQVERKFKYKTKSKTKMVRSTGTGTGRRQRASFGIGYCQDCHCYVKNLTKDYLGKHAARSNYGSSNPIYSSTCSSCLTKRKSRDPPNGRLLGSYKFRSRSLDIYERIPRTLQRRK